MPKSLNNLRKRWLAQRSPNTSPAEALPRPLSWELQPRGVPGMQLLERSHQEQVALCSSAVGMQRWLTSHSPRAVNDQRVPEQSKPYESLCPRAAPLVLCLLHATKSCPGFAKYLEVMQDKCCRMRGVVMPCISHTEETQSLLVT